MISQTVFALFIFFTPGTHQMPQEERTTYYPDMNECTRVKALKENLFRKVARSDQKYVSKCKRITILVPGAK